MKDYLNNTEIKEAIILTYCRNLVDHFVNGKVMTDKEKTNLKKGGTFIKNTLKSMIQRLGEDTAKKYVRTFEDSKVTVITNSELEVLAKRKDADIKAAYEDSKEYFDLVEIVMDKCCKNCKGDWKKCDLCKHFDNQEIIPFDEENDLGNCKYAYTKD